MGTGGSVKIRAGCIVEVEYELRDADGALVEDSQEGGPMIYLHGNEEIPPGLETELEGHEEGDKLNVTLPPGAAYGEYNPDGLVAVPRDQFPPDAEIVPGDWIDVTLADEEGQAPENPEEMEMKVVEISPDAIVLDANHPLAGQACTFDLKIVSVRQANAEEIEEHAKLAEREEKGEPEEKAEGEEKEEEQA
jgi:FKBP-type peptidyl-prolyl cis-trans isomerase SlyD